MGSTLNPRTVLSRYPSAVRPSAGPEPLGNAGGLSGSLLWRFRAGPRALVLRAWPADGPPRPALERVHAWLAEAGPLGFVPVPIAATDGRTLVGHAGRLWEVGPWLEGSPDLNRPPSPGHLKAGFAALAAFHQALSGHQEVGPSPGLLARLAEVDTWLSQGFRSLGDALDASDDPRRLPARQWLDAARAFAPGVRSRLAEASRRDVVARPCLRDARPEHFLFVGERVAGLVDFGAMGLDSVATDLARLSAEWLGDDPAARRAAMDAYVSIRQLDANEARLIPVFEDSAALLTGGRWASWHFLEGRAFSDPSAVGRGLAKGVERLGRLAGPFTRNPS